MEAQINQRMIANVTQEYALRVVDRALPADPKDVLRPEQAAVRRAGRCGGTTALVHGRAVCRLLAQLTPTAFGRLIVRRQTVVSGNLDE